MPSSRVSRILSALLGLGVAAVGVAGLATPPPAVTIDRAAIAAAARAPGEALAGSTLALAADGLAQALRQQADKAAADGMTVLDSAVRHAPSSRRDATPRAVQSVGIAAPPQPPVLASVLVQPDSFPIAMGVAAGSSGTAAASQAEAIAKAQKAAVQASGRRPVLATAMAEGTPVILVLQGLPPGSGYAVHALALDAAALARPVLEPIGRGGAAVALLDREGKALASAGTPESGGKAVTQPLPWGGDALRLSLTPPAPPDMAPLLPAPVPDRARGALFAATVLLGLLIMLVAALNRPKST